MKKALLKLMLKLAMLLALWTLKDQTKSKINRSLAARMKSLLRKIVGIRDAPEDNVQPEPDIDTEDRIGEERIRIIDFFNQLRERIESWKLPASDSKH
ncbi:MAG: hypothetical protein IJG25_03550 [Thermoguttaceae bacterium]|nr:hypothetical protein [Thermoguttaceae bacterium]MBQ6620188.1 hypothetical protein [Thermoguttaceae bacterium]